MVGLVLHPRPTIRFNISSSRPGRVNISTRPCILIFPSVSMNIGPVGPIRRAELGEQDGQVREQVEQGLLAHPSFSPAGLGLGPQNWVVCSTSVSVQCSSGYSASVSTIPKLASGTTSSQISASR